MNQQTTLTPEIKVSRKDDGKGAIEARTEIALGFDRRKLVIETSKMSFRPGVSCTAKVMQESECGRFVSHAFGLRKGCGDFSRKVAEDPGLRGTEKAILTMHKAVLQGLDLLIAEAKSHYETAPQPTAEAI